MIKLCPPAIIYLIFSVTQILIDLFKALYNTAIVKCIVTIMVTLLLNILCEQGLGLVSWVIVFIPFIFMTLIVTVILYVFGLDAATGSFDYTYTRDKTTLSNFDNIKIDSLGNIIIYDPEYDSNTNPVYYESPNIIVPNPKNNDGNISNLKITPNFSSSPAYQS